MSNPAVVFEYKGMDSLSRPVYMDGSGNLWKDTDPRAHVPASLCSAHDNAFEGKPDLPFRGRARFVPSRKTW